MKISDHILRFSYDRWKKPFVKKRSGLDDYLQFFAQSMKLPQDKVFNNIQRYGNTTAASIPIALDEALEMKLIGDGSTVILLGLGAGVTWGAVVARLVS